MHFFVEAETNPGLDAVRPAVNDLLNFIRALEEKLAGYRSFGRLTRDADPRRRPLR